MCKCGQPTDNGKLCVKCLEAELFAVDMALGNRAAFDAFDTRAAKIQYACDESKRGDKLQGDLDRSNAKIADLSKIIEDIKLKNVDSMEKLKTREAELAAQIGYSGKFQTALTECKDFVKAARARLKPDRLREVDCYLGLASITAERAFQVGPHDLNTGRTVLCKSCGLPYDPNDMTIVDSVGDSWCPNCNWIVGKEPELEDIHDVLRELAFTHPISKDMQSRMWEVIGQYVSGQRTVSGLKNK